MLKGDRAGLELGRHYCFSHLGYRQEAVRIAQLMAERYGQHPGIQAWQLDNEYGCHDTTYSYSEAARVGFSQWLQGRYGNIDTLNQAWGNVFWSMQYQSFGQIQLPNLTVTEANPTHQLDFRRFSSDQVVAFNHAQVTVIKHYSSAPVSHNYMGRVNEFDHFAVADDLDFVTWDSYPLGFLEDRVGATPAQQRRYAQQGDCDFQAFHHDLYRATSRRSGQDNGRWWVMEQQPGPVNWAPYNPAPLPGMVRLWSWEAIAHGAEVVSYFRWRQLPFAQEQMHAGLRNPDNSESKAWSEVAQLALELKHTAPMAPLEANVALVYDYAAEMAWQVQPHVASKAYFDLVFDHYKALRKLGLSVDIVSLDRHDLSQYSLILVPGLITLTDAQKQHLKKFKGIQLLGPRIGTRTQAMHIPPSLPPAMQGVAIRVVQYESLRPDLFRPVKAIAGDFSLPEQSNVQHWLEHLETSHDSCKTLISTEQNQPVLLQQANTYYLGAWLNQAGLIAIIKHLCQQAKITPMAMPEGVRCRDTQDERFWFNYDNQPHEVDGITLEPCGVVRVKKS